MPIAESLSVSHTGTFRFQNHFHLLSFEQQDRSVAQVEVDKVLGLVRYEASKVPAHDAVPGSSFPRIKLQ